MGNERIVLKKGNIPVENEEELGAILGWGGGKAVYRKAFASLLTYLRRINSSTRPGT